MTLIAEFEADKYDRTGDFGSGGHNLVIFDK
jgi:hypothetical protein